MQLTHVLALALSIFNLVSFLWLACTVWLNGDRRSLIARVGVVGLSLSALFFFIHALLISGPYSQTASLVSADFLWRLIWLPALGVPYIWFMIGLHYASLINPQWERRRPLLLIVSGLLGTCVLVLLLFNQATFTFARSIRLFAYDDIPQDTNTGVLSPLILLPIVFLVYVTFCAIGPWFTPGRVARLIKVAILFLFGGRNRLRGRSLRSGLIDAFWEDKTETEQLEEPVLSWHQARPGLLLAALLMVALTTSLGGLGVWSMFNWLRHGRISPPTVSGPQAEMLPFNLMLIDILAVGAVACVLLLIGYSIVRHGILIERPLARRGFFEQWRGIVIVASVVALFVAVFVAITRTNVSGLLLVTLVTTGIYALFTWSSYTAHDRYISMLRPFLRSTNLSHWLKTDLRKTEQNMEDLFFHLCKDVLAVQCARLDVLAGSVKRRFSYRWNVGEEDEKQESALWGRQRMASKPPLRLNSQGGRKQPRVQAYRIRILLHGHEAICWVVPIYDELGLVAKLYLGPREDGAGFTDEDMDLAHACGQRILDTLRDHEAMLAVAGLLRRRTVDVKLLGAQQRRVLHDEILPQMHLALLKLETLRPFVDGRQSIAGPPQADVALNEAVSIISGAHRQLAAMMRATVTSAPHRLERDGMMQAIHTLIAQDFRQSFDEVSWQVSDATARQIDDLVPPAIAELIFAAVQEALRNAARHARGTDIHRKLKLTLTATCMPDLAVTVADNGVGILSASSSTTGTGGGLLTHSALLAIVGGSLSVKSEPDNGVTVQIVLPAGTLV
ncbi:sensor histidine kinase [Ktedonospora formicarum]|nr:ATP-binding protein [Ktedonospora formicarum]